MKGDSWTEGNVMLPFCLFWLCFGLGHTQLCSGLTSGSMIRDHFWRAQGPYEVLGIKPGQLHSRVLPTTIFPDPHVLLLGPMEIH